MKFKVMCTPLSGVVHTGCTVCQVFLWLDCKSMIVEFLVILSGYLRTYSLV